MRCVTRNSTPRRWRRPGARLRIAIRRAAVDLVIVRHQAHGARGGRQLAPGSDEQEPACTAQKRRHCFRGRRVRGILNLRGRGCARFVRLGQQRRIRQNAVIKAVIDRVPEAARNAARRSIPAATMANAVAGQQSSRTSRAMWYGSRAPSSAMRGEIIPPGLPRWGRSAVESTKVVRMRMTASASLKTSSILNMFHNPFGSGSEFSRDGFVRRGGITCLAGASATGFAELGGHSCIVAGELQEIEAT